MTASLSFAAPLLLVLAQGAATTDDDPAIAEAVEALGKAVKAKDDTAAVGQIDTLTQKVKGAGPKDRAKIAKAVGACFDATRVPTEMQAKQEVFKLYVGAAASLSTMGEEGVKPLLAAIDQRKFKREVDLRAQLVGAAGGTKSPNAIKPLLDLLEDKDYPIIAASAKALGNYADAKEADRKKIVEQLVKHLESAANEASQIGGDGEAQRKYEAIGGPLLDSLSVVAGQQIREPLAWTKWWNDNKKKKW